LDLRDYLRIARQWWWLVLAGAAVAVGGAAVVTARTPPTYATTMTFFITTPHDGVSDAYQGGLFSQQRVKSYADLTTSDRLAHAVAGDLRGVVSADRIRRQISAQAVPDTVLLRVTVTDSSPALSRQIGWSLSRQFKRLVETLETPPGADDPAVKVEVIAGPRLETVPVSPQPLRNYGVAAALGLLAGLGVAVLRELTDTSVKSVEILRKVVGAPVLGSIPRDPSARRSPLVLTHSADSIRAEALRQLRTNLRYIGVDHPVRTIVITSAVPSEGKSTTAANLAAVVAASGRRVLLVDADLRRRSLATYLGLEGAVGLTDVLVGQTSASEVAQPWGPAGLRVLASGFTPPNPSELVGSRHMAELLDRLREEFELVVIDAPPLLPVTDAAVLAANADGALLVARYGKTPQCQVTAAADALRAVDARLLGCVLNMVPVTRADAYLYQYGGDAREGRRRRAERPPAVTPLVSSHAANAPAQAPAAPR